MLSTQVFRKLVSTNHLQRSVSKAFGCAFSSSSAIRSSIVSRHRVKLATIDVRHKSSLATSNSVDLTTRSHKEEWMVNLRGGKDDNWLQGDRDVSWYTGVAPANGCPGTDEEGKIRSLPLPNLSAVTRQSAKEYFDNSWSLYETLFAGLKGEEGFYRPPVHGLRHPQIFYYGHTACLYVNKLRVSGVLEKPINAYFESIFEVGVDEMLWDDMHKNDMIWPTVGEVHEYRAAVYKTISNTISNHPSLEDYGGTKPVVVNQEHPMWALFMGFEHERIHLETSSVLFRETPIHLVQTPLNWPPIHPSARRMDAPNSHPDEGVHFPVNNMISVDTENKVNLGKHPAFPSFGWDNEYGERTITVPPFKASEHMITNGEFWHFVAEGGYRDETYWCDDGWAWRKHRNMKWPFFWIPDGPQGSHKYKLRSVFEELPMQWDWPVDVNYYEAKAYCRWKSQNKLPNESSYRLLTEAEHHIIRHEEHSLDAARTDVCADKVMVTSGETFSKGETASNLNLAFSSQSPVDAFPSSHTGHRDTTGNAWEWTEDHFNPLKGFEVHHVYDDFSTPCFDGKHSMIVGGSFISTGDEASVFARFHFRPHFLQHSGFRLVQSDGEVPSTNLFPGNFEGQAAAAAKVAAENDESNDGGDSINVYESNHLLNMYLSLHFPNSGMSNGVQPIINHERVPNYSLRFPQRVSQLLVSLKPERTNGRALDIGCSVGGSSFELAKTFDSVEAFDFSQTFVETAKKMQRDEPVRFNIPIEADIHEEVLAIHEDGIDKIIREKVNFWTGDACKLKDYEPTIGKYDGVTMANVLCRLPDPVACLDGLEAVVNKGGVAVLVTPFSWLDNFTHRSKWLGGFYDPVSGEAIYSKDILKALMEERGFKKIHEEQMPLLIREHQRKYQYIVSEATGWRRI